MARISAYIPAFAFFLAFAPGTARSANLVALRSQSVAALPSAASDATLAATGDRLLALGDRSAWVWTRGAGDWTQLTGEAPDRPAGFTSYGGGLLVATRPEGSGGFGSLIRVVVSADTISTERVFELPAAIDEAVLVAWRDTIHFAGRDALGTMRMFSRSLLVADSAWIAGDPPDAGDGVLASLVVQDVSLFAIMNAGSAGARVFRESEGGGWIEREPLGEAIVPSSVRAIGQAHILALGAAAPADTDAARVYSYHVMTNVWTSLGDVPVDHVLQAQPWGDGFAFAGLAAGGRSVGVSEVVMQKRLLRPLDWIVIVLYLCGMAGVGLYCYLREKRHTTSDFFLGGRNIPFWAAGLSLYATGTSAISYIAIPAKSFATNWVYLAGNVVGLVATVFVAIWIVPLIRRLNLTSVYQYLEMRFHPAIRMLASAICIVLQLGGRMSVVLYLPSLAISAVTGLDVIWSIVIMGGITIVYTVMGGMKAVIWTDVIQVIVMLGGAFFAIGFVILKLDGGFGEFLGTAAVDHKMRTFDWSWDLTKATVWGFIFLAALDLLTYPKDQVMMQRVLSTKSAKDAGWSVWTLAAVVVPGSLTFYAIGTALYVFYKRHPEKMNPLLTVDATFPHFIAAELPVGITGLIIAGIFAASMSTLSSCINSVATLVSVDFYEKLAKNPDPKVSVRIAEVLTIVAGLIGVGTAIALSFFDIRSFFDLSLELAGLLGGGFAGTYALGIFTKRANWQGAAIGVIVSIVVTLVAWSFRMVHSVFYSAIAIFTCIVVGYAASLFFPPPDRSLAGLTIARTRKSGG